MGWNIIKVLLALLFIGIGLLIILLEIIAILDPVGTKMADDSDPFGDPYVSPVFHIFMFGVAIACFVLAYLIARRPTATLK